MKNSRRHIDRSGIGLFVLALSIVFASAIFAPLAALAQDIVAPTPGSYAPPDAAPPPEPIPEASVPRQDDGSMVSVPIPGGGEILVEGPASEKPASIGPLEHWASLRNNPFSVGTGPIGPIAPSQ